MTELQTWRDVNAVARFVSRREQTIALVCDVCDHDVVYVRIRDLEQLGWTSKWFGCECVERQRLTLEGTRRVVDGILGSRRSGLATCRTVEDIRIEAWSA